VEKIKGRSDRDINALGLQRIKGALFFSRRHFEWDTCYFRGPENRTSAKFKIRKKKIIKGIHEKKL